MPRSILILVLALMTAFGPMAIDMYLPALPQIARDLHNEYGRAELTLSAFFLGFAFSQLFYGPIADRYGRRVPMLFGICVYIIGSAGCALAQDLHLLIASRFIQAVGGSAGPMLARAVVRDLYSGAKVSRVLSLMALIMGAAPMLAPLIGGQILLVGTWRTIFWVTTSFGSIMLVMVLLILPETLPPERRSASASLGAMVKSYAILLRNPLFLSYALGGGFVFGGVFSFLAGSPFVYITLYHVPPQLYGVLFGVNILGLMALSALNAKIVTRYGTERILSFGIGMAATAGIVLAAVTFLHIGGLAALLVPLFFFVASLGLTNANSMAGCLNMFPERAGAASAVVGALQMITGSALGAMVGAFGNGTAEPMAGFVCLAGITAFICQRGLGHYSRVKHRREGHAVPRTP